jgi:hypothetical protein
MDTRRGQIIGAVGTVLTGLLIAAAATAQLPNGTAHWKSTIEVEGDAAAGVGPLESEVWTKPGKLRMQTQVLGMTQNLFKSGDAIYQWIEGQKNGMKMNAALGGRAAATGDYASRIDEYLSKGKKVGSETIDGHPCDIYELTVDTAPGGPRKETVSLATDLHNFPLKVVAQSAGTKITSRNRNVSFSTTLSEAAMAPPKDIDFKDMSEMLKGMQPPPQ